MATAPFFQKLQPEERAAIAERFRPRRFGRGARIVEEGAAGGGLYLILVGEVEVVRGTAESEIKLGALGEGSYFGEMSLLRGGAAAQERHLAEVGAFSERAELDLALGGAAHDLHLTDEDQVQAAARRALFDDARATAEATRTEALGDRGALLRLQLLEERRGRHQRRQQALAVELAQRARDAGMLGHQLV